MKKSIYGALLGLGLIMTGCTNVGDDASISKKDVILIIHHYPSGVCENIIHRTVTNHYLYGLDDSLYEEKDNNVTCSDFGRKNIESLDDLKDEKGANNLCHEFIKPDENDTSANSSDSNETKACVVGSDWSI